MKKGIIYLTVFMTALLLWAMDMVFYEGHMHPVKTSDPLPSSYSRVTKDDLLRVGVVANPVSYFITSKGATGLEYDLSHAFAQYLGVKINITEYPTRDALFNALTHHEIDIAASNLLFDPNKTALYQLGPAYYSASWQLVYHKGTLRPKSLNDLKGTLVVSKGSGLNGLLLELKDQYPNLTWQVEDKTEEELLMDVASGKIPYTVANSILVATTQSIRPDIAIAFDVADETTVHWYLAKSDKFDLQAKLLDFMNKAMEDGTIANLEEKYVSHLKEFNYIDSRTYVDAIKNILPKYKPFFEEYRGNLDWRLLAAVAYQESHWNPLATSPTGVRGIMMLTKNTAEAMNVPDRLDAQQSIRGGADYLNFLVQKMPDEIKEDQRIWYALVAYNMGLGHLFDALQLTKDLGGNPYNWLDVKNNLPLLGRREYYSKLKYGHASGIQAFQYVENIRRYLHILNNYYRVKASEDGEGNLLHEEEQALVSPPPPPESQPAEAAASKSGA